mgnify:CR=1 FL=1
MVGLSVGLFVGVRVNCETGGRLGFEDGDWVGELDGVCDRIGKVGGRETCGVDRGLTVGDRVGDCGEVLIKCHIDSGA